MYPLLFQITKKVNFLCLHNEWKKFLQKYEFLQSLTNREKEVVNGLLKGMSYKLIAEKMEISINTVRKHIRNIYSKLDINSKGQLVGKYIKFIDTFEN